MITIKTDANNDIDIGFGNAISLVSDDIAAAQDIRSATLMRRGENIYNLNEGVGYLEYIFSPQQDYGLARKSLYDTITSHPDVTGIRQLVLNIDNGVFNYEAIINTIYGETTIGN